MGNVVSGAVEGVTGKGAAEEAKKSGRAARDLSRTQADLLKMAIPYLQQMGPLFSGLMGNVNQDATQAYQRAQQFDPAQETARAMDAYDSAARESLDREVGQANTPFSMRGFTQGNSSSDQSGANADLYSRRAHERGQFKAGLQLRETDRRDEVTGRASDRLARGFQLLDPTGRSTSVAGGLQGPANTNMQMSQMYGQQAARANPGALIPIVGDALKGIKFPWQKTQDKYGPFVH